MSESSRRLKVITCQIPVIITNRNIKSRHNSKRANFNNLKEVKTLPLIGSRTKNSEFGPSVLLANTMSLLPKIDEVRCVVHEENPDLVCINETWLQASTINEHLFIPGYNVMFKNRASQLHGGVCIYIKNLTPYKRLSDLEDPEFEVASYQASKTTSWYFLHNRRYDISPSKIRRQCYVRLPNNHTHLHGGPLSRMRYPIDGRF